MLGHPGFRVLGGSYGGFTAPEEGTEAVPGWWSCSRSGGRRRRRGRARTALQRKVGRVV